MKIDFLKSWMKKNCSNYWLVLLVNNLEFFDLFLYIHFATVLHAHFSPHENVFLSESFNLMNIYFVAPLLSLIFALYGDNKGRKPVIVLCSLTMVVTTALIAILPTYAEIGLWATTLFVVLRLIQGIALSGEPYAAALYVIESVPIEKCAFYFSVFCATEIVGSLLALMLISICLHYDLSWRFPFICSIFPILLVALVRIVLSETEEYSERSNWDRRKSISNIREIKEFYARLPFKQINTICVALVNFGYPFAFVTSYVFMAKYLSAHYGYTLKDIVTHNIYLGIFEIILGISMGYLTILFSIRCYVLQAVRIIFAMIMAIMMPFALDYYHNIWLVFMFQVIFVTCMKTDLVIGSLYKAFPVIGRFTMMSVGHMANRFISFIVMTFILYVLNQKFGLLGNSFIMLGGCSLVLLGLFLYVPYEHYNFDRISHSNHEMK
ncbi:proline/betaine transporter [Caedimonas varicaedens]|uniref:Proline/betaine transporter n=1 Tax=Caedimonas varicaedens TaxID=1629334 RepID=A0A0K8MBW6_9PROT|nr:proline/betaine transporter [Caedimonas varicaedens]